PLGCWRDILRQKDLSGDKAAKIDNDKCISCGACVYQCPFGAITDKSFIINVIDMIQRSNNNEKYKVYAVVAPAIGSQFSYGKLGQVVSGIKKLGFFTVIEAALGADMVSMMESRELAEKGDYLTSSCCPAFVDYIHKNFPDMVDHISTNLSPMATIAQFIKSTDPGCKVVFIGPCTAKKMEFQKESVRPYIDCVITFEELQALFDSKDIDIRELDEDLLDNASYFGRIFARSGGLCDAVKQALSEQDLGSFELKAVSCDGIEACKAALLKKSKNVLDANFIEGMACVGGCIGGAGCLTHGEKNKAEVDKYGKEALERTISEAVSVVKFPEHSHN
ncbi:MAG: 4Fe-4S binding protein, partial [Oscillospiraceae bacterium]|nr:4Fe-4S binding protein [Oscillospiraceae bacterium]